MDIAVQEMVDRLASQLRRPAVLEDRFLRLVTYSAHETMVDEVREASILRRHASADVRHWLNAAGVLQAGGPFRVPGNDKLRMLPRICIPVHHRELLLGYLWFVDADESVPPAALERCAQAVAELGALLHRGSVASVPSSARVAGALRALLSDSPRAASAARSLAEDDLISADDESVVAVVQLANGGAALSGAATTGGPATTFRGPATTYGGATTGTPVQAALAEALIGSPYLCRRGGVLHLARKDHSVLLLAAPGAAGLLRSQLESLHAAATAELATVEPNLALVIGVGGCRPELADANESYREARMAALVGGAVPSVGPVVQWSELGVYQVAASLATSGGGGALLHDGLRPLLDAPEALPLLETLETYLDAAGNAQMTAQTLHLHRTSLYYRLQRIEQLAGTDLKDGRQRLLLHLTLKVARLTGHYLPRHSEGPTSTRPAPGAAGHTAGRTTGRTAGRTAVSRVHVPLSATG